MLLGEEEHMDVTAMTSKPENRARRRPAPSRDNLLIYDTYIVVRCEKTYPLSSLSN